MASDYFIRRWQQALSSAIIRAFGLYALASARFLGCNNTTP